MCRQDQFNYHQQSIDNFYITFRLAFKTVILFHNPIVEISQWNVEHLGYFIMDYFQAKASERHIDTSKRVSKTPPHLSCWHIVKYLYWKSIIDNSLWSPSKPGNPQCVLTFWEGGFLGWYCCFVHHHLRFHREYNVLQASLWHVIFFPIS